MKKGINMYNPVVRLMFRGTYPIDIPHPMLVETTLEELYRDNPWLVMAAAKIEEHLEKYGCYWPDETIEIALSRKAA